MRRAIGAALTVLTTMLTVPLAAGTATAAPMQAAVAQTSAAQLQPSGLNGPYDSLKECDLARADAHAAGYVADLCYVDTLGSAQRWYFESYYQKATLGPYASAAVCGTHRSQLAAEGYTVGACYLDMIGARPGWKFDASV